METEGLEKDISYKWNKYESRGSNTQRQKRLLKKGHNQRQTKALYNDKGINTRR